MSDSTREVDYNILLERISAQTETYIEFSNVLLKLVELIGDLKDSISHDKEYIIETLLTEIESSRKALDFTHKDTVSQVTIFFNQILQEFLKLSEANNKNHSTYTDKILIMIENQTMILNKLNNVLIHEEKRAKLKSKLYTYVLAIGSLISILGILIGLNVIQLQFFPK